MGSERRENPLVEKNACIHLLLSHIITYYIICIIHTFMGKYICANVHAYTYAFICMYIQTYVYIYVCTQRA